MTPDARAARLRAWLPPALTFFINGAIYGVWATQVPMAKARLGVDDAAFGRLLLFMGLGAILAMAASGRLIPIIGAARLITISFAVFVLSLLALAVFGDHAVFAVALVLFGGSGGMMDVAMNAVASETELHIGRPVMSSIHGMWSIGGLASAGFGGLLLPWLGNVGEAVVASILFLLLFLWVRPRFAVSGKATRNAERPRERIPGAIWLVALLAFLCFSTEDSVRDWSALYLRNGLAAPLAQAAWGFAAYSACMGTSRFAGDWIRHHASDRTIVLSGGILAAFGFSIAGATESYALAIAGFALVGVGLSNIVPIFVSAAGRSPSPAAAVSLVVTLGYSGYLVSPPALGAIAAYASLASMFVVVGAVALSIGLAWLVLSRYLPARR